MLWHFSSTHLFQNRLWWFKLISGREYWVCQLRRQCACKCCSIFWGEKTWKCYRVEGKFSLELFWRCKYQHYSFYIHNNLFSSAFPLLPLHLRTSCVPALITPVVHTLIEKYIDWIINLPSILLLRLTSTTSACRSTWLRKWCALTLYR